MYGNMIDQIWLEFGFRANSIFQKNPLYNAYIRCDIAGVSRFDLFYSKSDSDSFLIFQPSFILINRGRFTPFSIINKLDHQQSSS